jgi:glycosyltransferase involved in cell wall biosynthesis
VVRLLLHAPNVHVGGGLVLLKDLLAARNLGNIWANLDMRASGVLKLPSTADCHFVTPTPLSRLKAELRLRRVAEHDDLVLCFHGMPPLLPVRGRVVVFQQNRNYLGLTPLSHFSGRTRIRLGFERFVCRAFKGRVSEYIVQTPSMQSAVKAWHGGSPVVRVMPFMGITNGAPNRPELDKACDFLYVADGEAHKNHRVLLAAWVLLAQEGVFPSLGLTLPDRFAGLWREFEQQINAHGVRVRNFGALTHDSVMNLYCSTKALVFPSTTESFGLPLLEATRFGLPIVASELDYVRDVCSPSETFDPRSPVSIARAIKRFLNIPTDPIRIHSAAEFLAELRT